MTSESHHDEILKTISEQFKGILEYSKVGVYIYLNDTHVLWNKNLAQLLGYASTKDLHLEENTFLEQLVAPKSQKTLVRAYQNAMENMVGSTVSITWKKKGKGTVTTEVILVPIEYSGHLLALHFVKKK